jgi:cytochrome c
MIKFLRPLLFAIGLTGLAATAHAADKGTQAEATAMVRKAAAHMKANGADKTLAEASNAKGQFVDRDLYLSIYDLNGKVVAHGTNPKLIGVDVSNLKDADDKFFIKDIMAKAKADGKGTVDYKWTDPLTKQISAKSTYFQKEGNYIIACGTYK